MKQKSYLTIEEVVSLPNFSGVNISNDGENVAYEKKITNWKENKYNSHVWIYEKKTDKNYPLTVGKEESKRPIWSPDCSELAYLSKVGEEDKEKDQIFIKPKDGYKGIQVTDECEGVSSYKWSPDGKGIYYIAQLPESEDMKKRKELYGDIEYVDKEYRQNAIYYIDVEESISKLAEDINLPEDLRNDNNDNCNEESKEKDSKNEKSFGKKIVGDGEFFIKDFDISPKGDKLVLSITPTPDMKDWSNVDIYIFDIESNINTKLDIDAVLGTSVVFSPDGTKVCYTRSNRSREYYKNNIEDSTIEIYNLETKEATHPIYGLDIEATPIKWIDKGILMSWQEKTSFLIGVLYEDGRIEILGDRENNFEWMASITMDGEHLAYAKATSTEIFEIYLDDKKITDNNSLIKDKMISKKEVVSWESSDGLEIEGVLSLPQDFDESKKYPLLLVVHGGPTWASFPIPAWSKYYPIEQFVEKGFIVLEPNYRGSSGYGEMFKKANYRNLGLGDYDDVISGVDMLIEKGMADKDRVGIMGWSQGGYISAFCSTYSDRFKAISAGAGISNWITYYVNTDIHPFTREYLGKNPWEDKEIYENTSPMTYIKSACTPTLIQHGGVDTRVPVPNAYELYQGLCDMGVDTELVIFKGMNHNSHKPGLNRAIMKQNLIWFSHYILGESIYGLRLL